MDDVLSHAALLELPSRPLQLLIQVSSCETEMLNAQPQLQGADRLTEEPMYGLHASLPLGRQAGCEDPALPSDKGLMVARGVIPSALVALTIKGCIRVRQGYLLNQAASWLLQGLNPSRPAITGTCPTATTSCACHQGCCSPYIHWGSQLPSMPSKQQHVAIG